MTEEKSKENIQKFSWKNYKTFSTYEEADSLRSHISEDFEHIKIKRSGPGGTKFTVKVGTAVKRKGVKNATK